MDEELQDLDQDASALLPTVLAILSAAAIYGASTGAAKDLATTLSVPARIGAALSAVALRVLMKLAQGGLSARKRQAVLDVLPEATERAVEAGVEIIEMAAQAVVDNVRSAGGTPGVSLPGMPYSEDLPGDSDDPKVVARRVASAVRNGARFHAVDEIEKTSPEGKEIKLRKTWHSHKDARTRASHAFLGDKSYEYHTVDVGDPFISITGAKLRYPGDPKAPLHEIARCRCWMSVR